MTEQFHISNGGHSPGSATDQLHEEYDRYQALFNAQPTIVQRFLEAQASQVAQAFSERALHVRFTLPDRVVSDPNQASSPLPVPTELREQAVGKFTDRVLGKNIHNSLRARLAELEQSSEPAVAVGTGLIRFAAAMHIIRNMLPAGRSVTYVAAADEEIPSIPVDDGLAPEIGHHRPHGRHCRGRWRRRRPRHASGPVCPGRTALLPASMGGVRRRRETACQLGGRG